MKTISTFAYAAARPNGLKNMIIFNVEVVSVHKMLRVFDLATKPNDVFPDR